MIDRSIRRRRRRFRRSFAPAETDRRRVRLFEGTCAAKRRDLAFETQETRKPLLCRESIGFWMGKGTPFDFLKPQTFTEYLRLLEGR